MIEVPIDKIIPIEEATLEIKKIMEDVKTNGIYVVTKDGKPHSAIIDIDYLEHLPEMENAGETKNINEMKQAEAESYDDFSVKTNNEEAVAPQSQTEMPTAPETVQAQPEQTQPAPETTPQQPPVQPVQPNSDILNDNVGPWRAPETPSSNNPNNNGEPQDLDI